MSVLICEIHIKVSLIMFCFVKHFCGFHNNEAMDGNEALDKVTALNGTH